MERKIYSDPTLEGYTLSGCLVHEESDDSYAVSVSAERPNQGSAPAHIRAMRVYVLRLSVYDEHVLEYVVSGKLADEIADGEGEPTGRYFLRMCLKAIEPEEVFKIAFKAGAKTGAKEAQAAMRKALGIDEDAM